MIFEKMPMSLDGYMEGNINPKWMFSEDRDYIIYCGIGSWRGPKGLTFLIDRDGYFRANERSGRIEFFDMMNVEFEIEGKMLVKLGLGGSFRAKFGNFFYRNEEPSFFLTEPKNAEDVVLYRIGWFFTPETAEDLKMGAKYHFLEYMTSFVVLPISALGDASEIAKHYQSEFEAKLKLFQVGLEYRKAFLSS